MNSLGCILFLNSASVLVGSNLANCDSNYKHTIYRIILWSPSAATFHTNYLDSRLSFVYAVIAFLWRFHAGNNIQSRAPDPVQYHHHHQLHLSCTYPFVCLSTCPESCPPPPPTSVSVRHYIHKGEPPVHYYYVNPIMPKTTIERECLAAATAILVLFAILNLLLQTNNQFKN